MQPRWLLAAILAIICAAYANHFQNSFHFDDAHTIVDNPSIRSLANIRKFFTDTTTFSVLPANRAWRPLVPASFAVDYWMGGGLKPVAFHLSTLLWFLLLVSILYLLANRIFDNAHPDAGNSLAAGFAAAWFGLHPVCAETVNYVIQRGDLYATLGVTAGLYLYASDGKGRKYGLYLIPVILGVLSKPPALVFPALLFAYAFVIENTPFRRAARQTIPSLLVCVAMGVLHARMIPATFSVGGISPFKYRITQPFVALRYFKSFFLPSSLSADTDMTPFDSFFDPLVLAGIVFLVATAAAAVFCSRRRETSPIGLGLWWFLVALAPTSLYPLAEVENDHRMFFPFAGLAIAVVWCVTLAWPRAYHRTASAVAAVLVLVLFAWGVHQRNEVWRSEATLWRDVTLKSPRNGRGLMNYGLSRMGAGDVAGGLDYFHRAEQYAPAYYVLEINLGIAEGEAGNDREAERHFQRAISLAPADSLSYQFYARWLYGRNRRAEAFVHARKAVALNPSNPNGPALLSRMESDVVDAEHAAVASPTAQNYLNLSLRYHQAGRYSDCIGAARAALARKPDLAEAYNNIAAAYEELGKWDDAIAAATEAIRLKPDFPIARNNLAWSLTQKQLAGR